jgi:hypothetical protein
LSVKAAWCAAIHYTVIGHKNGRPESQSTSVGGLGMSGEAEGTQGDHQHSGEKTKADSEAKEIKEYRNKNGGTAVSIRTDWRSEDGH